MRMDIIDRRQETPVRSMTKLARIMLRRNAGTAEPRCANTGQGP